VILQIPEDLVVRHLRVPSAYMASNWPLVHAAVSADGYDIAAAGTRGLALYSRRSGRWRLFGDVSQEKNIFTMAIVWLPKVTRAVLAQSHTLFWEKRKQYIYRYMIHTKCALVFFR
jgi:hypothetical protein